MARISLEGAQGSLYASNDAPSAKAVAINLRCNRLLESGGTTAPLSREEPTENVSDIIVEILSKTAFFVNPERGGSARARGGGSHERMARRGAPFFGGAVAADHRATGLASRHRPCACGMAGRSEERGFGTGTCAAMRHTCNEGIDLL